MRREDKDDLIRSFLATNAMLRAEAKALRRAIEARRGEAKHNPNWRTQPRAPKGTADGGQWVGGGKAAPSIRIPEERQRPSSDDVRTSASNDNRPQRRIRFGPQATLLTGEAVLRELSSANERARVREVIVQFGFDPQSARDVLAARAHVWATDLAPSIVAPPFDRIPFSGPVTNRVAERLMRFEQAHPGALGLAEAGDVDAQRAIAAVVEASLDGRPIPVLTIPLLGPGQGIITFNEREAELAAAMRIAGRTPAQIQTALDTIRRNRDTDAPTDRVRREAGVAYASRPPTRIRERWLQGSDRRLGLFPAQVAERLRGRTFSSFREFKEAVWTTVAEFPELTEGFDDVSIRRMRRGWAPLAPADHHFGGQVTYILHHRVRVVDDPDRLYDTSNLLILTPRAHQEVLPRRLHFARRRRQRSRS
jgi:hypothetical protein